MTDATDLRIAVNRLSRTLRAQKADSSVTDAQFSALARLHRDGAMTLADLSRQDGVTPPSMTKTVAVLVERGLVSKCGHSDDRRKVLLGATPAGAAFVEETRRRRDGWLSPRLAALTADERSTLADATEIMRRLAQQ
ncbi:MarR family transcriptional regulator [Curtobacterium flaccumfaciens]|uniref:MarR family winged helix-turn-helix transcriptional regulator n=1 Tax=Curtobacterium TaxID=2034 RepID=UPI00110DA80E|nr:MULTISPECIES: MarR family transcriptional regulator [Curtobacterium]QKS86662.1 MarR family transcriptional regulator [Curtobacterium flaccumfaciens pv. flaccumfaciens]TSD11175.1 MarR family transcriptional regulator [Curtobacterium sp. KBS0715]UWD83290.1 MarR family transcriptional regulator [Curtobacterium flaccumfaciens]